MGVEGELPPVKVLQKIFIADRVDIRRSVNVISQKQSLLEGNAIPLLGLCLRGVSGIFNGGDVFGFGNVIGMECAVAAVFLAVVHVEIQSN